MDRRTIEASLATVVRDNRFTIAVVFPVVGACILLASAWGWLPDPLAFNPLLIVVGVAVMRLPLIAGIVPLIDRRAAFVLLVLAAYTWTIEYVGVVSGVPYGEFEYGVALGPMVGGVPLALPLFFIPLAVNAYLFALLVEPGLSRRVWIRIPVVVALVIAIDLVLDPAAVALGFWAFETEGGYYGVPWTNFAGWVLSGTVAVLAVELAFSAESLRERVGECEFVLDDLVSFTLLWGLINLLFGNGMPVLVAGGLLLGLYANGRLDFLDMSVPGYSLFRSRG